MLRKTPLLLIICVGLAFHANAQLVLSPIPQSQPSAITNARLSVDSTGKTLTLPFFEDFSDYGLRFIADTNRWQQGTAIINNTLAVLPPSTGVATFDGSNLNGQPYSGENSTATGVADQLTSHLFNLTPYDTGQLKLTFYWQAQGRGEQPDGEDDLVLQFRTSAGEWQEAWSVSGGEATAPFQQETVTISDTTFLHETFQFRFQNTAKLSGAFDSWHLDYIHFYDSLADNPDLRFDVALSEQPDSFLRTYHDMPAEQFRADISGALRDTVFASIQHLADTFNVISHRFQLFQEGDTSALTEWQTGSIGQSTSFSGTNIINNLETMQLAALPQESTFQSISGDSLNFIMRFLVNSNEQDRLIPTSRNDTLLHEVTLHNYYAYDDGTAEFGIGIQENLGEIAYRYTLTQPDTLTAIDVGFIQLGASLAGESIRLKVWQQLDTGAVDNIPQYTQTAVVAYPAEKNGFIRFELDRPQVLEGVFFIGYEQQTDQRITLGYDINTTSGDNLFVNVGNGWEQNVQFLGSVMLRPIFARVADNGNPLAIRNEMQFPNLLVYPNPASTSIRIEGNIEQAQLITLTGRLVKEVNFNHKKLSKQINISDLPKGLYILQVSRHNYFTTKKVIIE